MNVLFVTSEAFPLVKTGGLGDVAGHLPLALQQLGQTVTLALPAYQSVLDKTDSEIVAHVSTSHGYVLIRETQLNEQGPRLWLIDHPTFSERAGQPYVDDNGAPWRDNSIRFGVFSQAVAKIASGQTSLAERFDIVHCNDWQTGLVPAFLSVAEQRPRTLFTIHNLAYQGIFPASCLETLHLPGELWSPLDGLVFHGQVSFIKGGLVFADRITTVSPTYAREILSDSFSYGLAGLLNHRSNDLSGIINGVDLDEWNPQTDHYIPQTYNADTLEDKQVNKQALQARFDLPADPDIFLVGNVGRLVEQKGVDIIIDALPALMKLPLQLIITGTGNSNLEKALRQAAEKWPGRFACHIGYSEAVAHLIEAGSDAFLMPSRFEPCGLNQMYSLVYGTPPIVARTGGLNDTVTETTKETLKNGQATGFFIDELDATGLTRSVREAMGLFTSREVWQRIQRAGMRQDFSWNHSAGEYIRLYREMTG